MPTGAYKNYMRGQRVLVTEQNFALGMQYSDVPLSEGASKALVNYDLKDSGAALIPRGGFRVLPGTARAVGMDPLQQRIHHVAQMAITSPELEDEMHRYAMFVDDDPVTSYYDIAAVRMLIEENILNGVPNMSRAIMDYDADQTWRLHARVISDPLRLHKMPYNGLRKWPVYTLLNNKPYFPATNIDGEVTTKGLATITGHKDVANEDYQATVSMITPRVISPTEAVNYGYNMLSPTPYTFSDQISAAVGPNYIILDGVLPYADDACTNIKFNARVGESVVFRLYAQFHDNVETYKFRWEIRDINSDSVTIYEDQESAAAHTYHFDSTHGHAIDEAGGHFIKIRVQPPYKQCSITVTAYAAADLTEPIQVMALASYSLSEDALKNLEVKNYDLSSATGACTWQQRAVLWGVRSAKNILFVSEVNSADYFPYPNNANVLDENIVACIPYLSDLLILTESKLVRATWAADGLSYTAKVIQDKLMLSAQDVDTIQVVKNMVFFKNGNYFYMIVPGVNKDTVELQLAPISKPITNLLDNFEEAITDIFMTMYNPARFGSPGVDQEYILRLADFHNYLDNAAIRNVYKFELCKANTATHAVSEVVGLFDFILNYDTMQRTWTSYIMEGNRARMLPYRQTITDTTTFINLANVPAEYINEAQETVQGYSAQAELIKVDITDMSDNFLLDFGLLPDGRRFKNWQFIDTGHRSQNSDLNKRYRELQFKLNNLSQYTLEFGTEFKLDDEIRKELFEYVTEQSTDGPDSPLYGWIFVTRKYANPVVFPGATLLEDEDPAEYETPYPPNTILASGDVLYSNRWVLGFSRLSKVSISKVALEVSGKGYSPQLKLLSFNERRYELTSLGWVFRTMNAR